jgi:hypothetical protein
LSCARGFEVLVKSLGWVNTVRFIHQFERSSNNYAAERDALVPELSSEDLVGRLSAMGQGEKERA